MIAFSAYWQLNPRVPSAAFILPKAAFAACNVRKAFDQRDAHNVFGLFREDAEFAAYLCSDAAACFVGQVFPVCGGWVAR